MEGHHILPCHIVADKDTVGNCSIQSSKRLAAFAALDVRVSTCSAWNAHHCLDHFRVMFNSILCADVGQFRAD